MKLIFATRPSALARWQTQWVCQSLQRAWPGLICEEKVITTQGDRILDRPLPEIGGKGLFTQELEAEILSGEVHAAVHSLKDLPVENPSYLCVGAVPLRAETGDVLVTTHGECLDNLPEGARVGTSSLRRAAQLLAYRPDLHVEPVRGNVDTRIRKAMKGEYQAVVLAGAGVVRLGLAEHISQWLPLDIMLPAPGQGALAVQCRSDDQQTLDLLAAIEDLSSRRTAETERSFLSALGGGCSLPVAASASLNNQQIELQGLVASADGARLIRVVGWGTSPQALGQDCAQQVLSQGAGDILELVSEG